MDWNKVQLIKGDIGNLAYYYPNNSFVEINDFVFEILENYKRGDDLSKIASYFKQSESDLFLFINKLEKNLTKNQTKSFDNISSIANIRNTYRITLHISNDCNLRCKYCYANGGNYTMPRDLMSVATAEKFVEFCVENFDKISNIVFFGGEPLMNIDIIEIICQKFSNYYKTGVIKHLPTFGIITNGTIMNDRILNILKKYISFITVSIDGPKSVNDYNRVFVNGKGSFEYISRFIKTIKSETNIIIRYEATYTDEHINQKITKKDLILFFKEEFGLNGIITDDLNIKLKANKQYIDLFLKETLSRVDFIDLPDGFWSILSAIVNDTKKEMCQIFKKIFAVSTHGDIYPCHMDTGIEHLKLGNIQGVNIFNNPNEYKDSFPLLFNIDNKEKLCSGCWAQNICAGCTRKWFFNEEKSKYGMQPNKNLCESNKQHIENILLLIAHIRRTPQKWTEFINFMDENFRTNND